jgi:hypothetical protein
MPDCCSFSMQFPAAVTRSEMAAAVAWTAAVLVFFQKHSCSNHQASGITDMKPAVLSTSTYNCLSTSIQQQHHDSNKYDRTPHLPVKGSGACVEPCMHGAVYCLFAAPL